MVSSSHIPYIRYHHLRLFASLLILLSTMERGAVAQEDVLVKPACFTNITVLVEFLTAKDSFQVETYILCPNTVFEFDGDNAQKPLKARRNIRVLCGEDGSRANNCTFTNARVAPVSCVRTDYFELVKNNVYFSGLTFGRTKLTQFYGSCPGDFTFHDCVFQNHDLGVSSILLNLPFVDNNDRHLMEEDESAALSLTDQQRDLQTESLIMLTTFDNCLFQFNTHGTETGQYQTHNVIHVDTLSNKLVLKDCIFHQNILNDEDRTSNSRVISVHPGSKLEMVGNCFLLNDVLGKGTVNVETADQVVAKNNFGTFDDNVRCQFIHVDSTDECLHYDLTTCPLDFDFVPPPVPAPQKLPSAGSASSLTTAFLLLLGFVGLLWQ